MKQLFSALFCALAIVLLGASLADAGQVPQPFSLMPNSYNTAFPAGMLNQNFAYALSYTDALSTTLTPSNWQVITTSQVAVSGSHLAVNTAAGAITITLPSPVNTSPLNAISLLDATRSFNTHNLTVSASGIAPINSGTGSSATFTGSTQGSEVVCVYLNSTIGYNCGVQ